MAARKTATKTTKKAVRKPAATVSKKTTAKVAKKPVAKVTKKPTAMVAKKPAVKVAKKPVAKAAKAPVVSAATKPAKKVHQRKGFRIGEFIVYPAHGVGQITDIEVEEIAGLQLELFVIRFEHDKMILRVPTAKVEEVGMRKLSDLPVAKKALDTLKGKPRVKRTMWSRRAQEYEAKINSGSLVLVSEVVRDLYRGDTQPEQSYSERQLYEQALDRMAREIGVVEKTDKHEATDQIERILGESAAAARKLDAEKIEAENDDNEKAA